MFYLAKEHNLHVVEDTSIKTSDSEDGDSDDSLPTLEGVVGFAARNVIDLTKDKSQEAAFSLDGSNLDVEIVHSTNSHGKTTSTYRPPARAKGQSCQPASSAGNSKRHQFTPMPKTRSHPKPSTSRVQASSSASTSKTPPKPLALSSTVVPSTRDSPQDEWRLKHNNLTSALVALRQLVMALRLVKGRREMASKASPADLRNFAHMGLIILRMVRISPPSPSAHYQRITAKTLNKDREQYTNKQRMEWVMAGWEPLKLAWDLMTDCQGLRGQLILTSTPGYANLFRQRCYDVWSLVGDNCSSLGKRRQSRW
jgi:hypothetical protein